MLLAAYWVQFLDQISIFYICIEIDLPKGNIGVSDEAVTELNKELISDNKKTFIQALEYYRKLENLSLEKVAYALAVCVKALKRGSTEVIKSECLNFIGAKDFI